MHELEYHSAHAQRREAGDFASPIFSLTPV